jgi:hypothetical protein
VAAAGRTYKQAAFSLLNLFQEFKQLHRAIPADTRSQLERPDDQRLKAGIFYLGEQIEHALFAGFLSNRTDITGFDTIVRASEIGMTYINIIIVTLHEIGQKRFDPGRWWNTSKSIGFLSEKTPFSGKVDGQCGNNPIRLLIGVQALFEVSHAVCMFEDSAGAFGPHEIRLILVHQNESDVPVFFRQISNGMQSESAHAYDPYLSHKRHRPKRLGHPLLPCRQSSDQTGLRKSTIHHDLISKDKTQQIDDELSFSYQLPPERCLDSIAMGFDISRIWV